MIKQKRFEPIRRDLGNLTPEGLEFLRAMCRLAAKNMPLPGMTGDQQVEGFMELLENGFMRFIGNDEWFSLQMLEGWRNGKEVWVPLSAKVSSKGQTSN